MTDKLTSVSFDIETTGFGRSEIVTTVGFRLPLGCRVFVNTAGVQVDAECIEGKLETTFGTPIILTKHLTEEQLLEAVTQFGTETLAPREYLLVAYNGERFRGGFDLPFMRSRYAEQDIRWPFSGIPYADLMPIFEQRFNTRGVDGEVSDLESVYDMLVGGEFSKSDPFKDSSEAVTAYEEQEFRKLLEHNVSDILRTDALASLAERYCSKSEFRLKSLTPVWEDS